MPKAAIIDLGSNTFHILISSPHESGTGFTTLYRERVFVGLSEGGLDIIKEEKLQLGLETIAHFKTILTAYGVEDYKVFGTAMLRSASNRQAFIGACEALLGHQIEIIYDDEGSELV